MDKTQRRQFHCVAQVPTPLLQPPRLAENRTSANDGQTIGPVGAMLGGRDKIKEEEEKKDDTKKKVSKSDTSLDLDSLQYHINIVLPDTRDQAVYDAIFKSLRDHLG